MEVAYDGHFFTKDIGRWMKFTDNNLRKLINLMHEIYESGATVSSQKMLETAEKFSWENSAKKLVEILEDNC